MNDFDFEVAKNIVLKQFMVYQKKYTITPYDCMLLCLGFFLNEHRKVNTKTFAITDNCIEVCQYIIGQPEALDDMIFSAFN